MRTLSKEVIKELNIMKGRLEDIDNMLTYPEVIADTKMTTRLTIEAGGLRPIVDRLLEYVRLVAEWQDINDNMHLFDISDRDAVSKEIADIENSLSVTIEQIYNLLRARDSVIDRIGVVFKSSANGDTLIHVLIGLYKKWADWFNWSLNIGNDLSLEIVGIGVAKVLLSENGVHQIINSDGQGTICVGVFELPASNSVDVDDKDIRVDIFRSSGAGGQHVNTTDSAVRLTHIPTGIVVVCQDERSQVSNRARARRTLLERVQEYDNRKYQDKLSMLRTTALKNAKNKIRKYDYMTNRVCDCILDRVFDLNEFLTTDVLNNRDKISL